MKDLVSPKQVARAIGVSESSLKRWCDRGLIETVRTAGGHRRLPISSVLTFLRESQQVLVAPELLGLPANSGTTERVIDRGCEQLQAALLEGNEPAARQTIFDLWLSGQRLSQICDRIIAGAFTAIGEKWECHEADVYQERRACEIISRILHEIEAGLPPADPRQVAMGGTPEGDPYTLPTTFVELVLRDSRWASRSLGSGIPMASLATAIRENRPRLFWLSVSHLTSETEFIQQFPLLNAAAEEVRTAIVVGGVALRPEVRQQLRYAAYCDTMGQLEEFARLVAARD